MPALPVWGAFAISAFLLTNVVDWRLAVGAGLLVWLGRRSSICT
jgi:hypothetical protein